MDQLKLIQEALDRAKIEGEKFFTKGNGSAGTRLRKEMQTIKNLAQEIRKGVSEKKAV